MSRQIHYLLHEGKLDQRFRAELARKVQAGLTVHSPVRSVWQEWTPEQRAAFQEELARRDGKAPSPRSASSSAPAKRKKRSYAPRRRQSTGRPRGRPASMSGATIRERVLALLAGGPMRTPEIADALPDFERASVLSLLPKLAMQGLVRRVGRGLFALPAAPGEGNAT